MRMGEGKRDRSHRDYREREREGAGKNQRRRGNDRDAKTGDELVVYRIICPDSVIGSVIGKSGKVINSIRQDTNAKVKVVDPFPGSRDRVITIYCHVNNKKEVEIDDEFDDDEPLCPAQNALAKVHAVIADMVASLRDSDKRREREEREECRILVPSSQSASIIGKSGSTIKRLRNKSRANIKVIPKDVSDPAHSCAMEFDNFVLITGDPEAVKKALFAVSAIMYKFTPKEDIPLDTNVPEAPPIIIIPSDDSMYHASGFYPAVDHSAASGGLPPVVGAIPISDIQGGNWPIYSSATPVVSGYGASRTEELILRVLCPSDKIGRVIGKGGSTIKSVRQASGARIEVDDVKKAGGGDDCVILITSVESPDDLKSMTIEAVLLLQEKINDEGDETVTIRLLVSQKVIGCIIGRSGSIINEIRNRTKANISISKGKKPKCASDSEELIEVVGKVASVRDALVQIVLRLRDDVLKERESDHKSSVVPEPIYSGGASFQISSVMPNIPPVHRSSYEHRDDIETRFDNLPSKPRYGHGSLPTREEEYESFSSYSEKPYRGLPPPSTLEMVVPGHAVGKVLGKGGANIANIRKISGADVEISDSKSSRGDRVAFISGTSDQKRSAENLIQAFIMAT